MTSYELLEDVKKEEFRNDNEDLIMDYNMLQIYEKFNPMIYTEEGEVFEKNGKIIFGFVEPIIYKHQA